MFDIHNLTSMQKRDKRKKLKKTEILESDRVQSFCCSQSHTLSKKKYTLNRALSLLFYILETMGLFYKAFRFSKLAVQFGCFAHMFNQYVAEVTWVSEECIS